MEEVNAVKTVKFDGTVIFYFSATGNCLAAAKEISENLGGASVRNIACFMKSAERVSFEADTVILIYPAYAYEMPVMVRRFIKRNSFAASYFAAFTTYGTKYGGALAEAVRLFAKKGITLNYAAGIPSVENFVAIFGAQKEEKRGRRLVLHNAAVKQVSGSVAVRVNNKIRTFRPFSSFVSIMFRIFRPVLPLFYGVRGKECTGCGVCVKVCPAGAVTLKEGKPRFSSKCEQCQACVHQCPKGAIKYFRKRTLESGYRHPGVTLQELMTNSSLGEE